MTHRIARTGPLALFLVASCDYSAPLMSDYEPSNTIAGTIVANGIEEPGLVFVFVFDAKNPPPPVGTGSPITYSAVPASAFSTKDGIKSAEYAVPYLADTTAENGFEAGYLVTALMDMDHNFSPFADILGGSTCGDWLGEHKADLSALYPQPVFVQDGELAADTTIVMSRQNLFQRPAFTLADPELTISKQMAADSLLDKAGKTQTYRILATGVHTEIPGECANIDKTCDPIRLDLPGPCERDPALTEAQCASTPACSCPLDTQEPCVTGFPVHFVDKLDNATGDAVPDGFHDWYPAELQAANELRDTWPRVYLEYQGLPVTDEDGHTVFENDLGEFEWPPGSGRIVKERWAAENYPVALELNFLGPGLIAPVGSDPFSTFLARELAITFSPAFRHYHADAGDAFPPDPANGPYDLFDLRCYADPAFGDGQFPSGDPGFQHPATCVPGQPVSITDVPSGVWRFTLITEPGQTWRMPNEIGMPAWALSKGIEEPLVSTETGDQGVYLWLE